MLAVVIIAATAGLIYWKVSSSRVYVENSTITAPLIDLSPDTAGTLQAVYVNEGDTIAANTPVAEVGTSLIFSKVGGVVVTVRNDIGKLVNAGDPVITMIDPTQLRVVGQVQENKGLSQIAVGDPVQFTVDAFGSQTFDGVVDEISPTSEASDIVFSISDQREEQNFDVKVRFDTSEYSQLKNGMSAKMWIYHQ